ncbi:MAG TPA: uracil-DNA glycosylase family protein [Micropepsaceae bacterium]|nr:uracil-DNA glycosylase family protein [Micropepsaceae bacterium]
MPAQTRLAALVSDIHACRSCAAELPHGVRPVLRISGTARLCIAGQAPGIRVHNSGIPYNDPSGKRLRAWLGIDADTFYDERRVAIVPMGFCFPGYDAAGGDKPPRAECGRLWHDRLFAAAPKFKLMLAIGSYAQTYHLKSGAKKSMTETVRAWREYGPVIPLPHPSWRNIGWLKKNPWFESELLPDLRARVTEILSCAR